MVDQLPRIAEDALAALDAAVRQERAAEVTKILAVAAAADSYEFDVEDFREALDATDGLQRRIQPGADGTPLVGEFLALEIGPILGISPEAALSMLGDVLNVRHRHPALWAAFIEGAVAWAHARFVAFQCLSLSASAAALVDQRCAHALRIWPISRLLHHLKAWIIEADPEAAAAKEAVARHGRHVDISGIEDGHCHLFGRLSAEDAIAFDQALDAVADTLPAPELPSQLAQHEHDSARLSKLNRDARRAAAVGVLAKQAFGQEALPVQLVVHINGDDPALHGEPGQPEASGAATIERWGAFLSSRLPEFLSGSRVVVRPVIDLNTNASIEHYRPDARMRFALIQRHPVEVFPYGTRASRGCDIDHPVAYHPDGPPDQTRMDNLGPLSRFSHRGKTHGGFEVDQISPGVFHWRTPAGFEYLVSPAGTINITAPTGPRPLRAQPVRSWREPPDWTPDPAPDDPVWDQPERNEALAWAIHQHTLHPSPALPAA